MLTIIQKHFPNLSSEQLELLKTYAELLLEWNTKINLISRKDVENIEVHHILHSLSIAKVIQFKSGSKVLDAGTGGGLPGIPLAILFPEVHFSLVDSRAKKIKAVEAMCKEIGLDNVSTYSERVENLSEAYEFIISRAVTQLPEFLRWTSGLFSKRQFNTLPNGILYLKGGIIESEINELNKRIMLFSLSDYYSEPFFEEKSIIYIEMKGVRG